MILIRPETAADSGAIEALSVAAFPTPGEARLVDRLRTSASPFLCLIAESAGELLGYIVFSPVTIDSEASICLMGLAPMAVAPEHQRKGIGSKLVRAGLRECRNIGAAAVFVLGHPAFYPRFGFQPASRFGIGCEYAVPDDVFLVLELKKNCLDGTTATVRYHSAFAEL